MSLKLQHQINYLPMIVLQEQKPYLILQLPNKNK